jgi:hypothetical protein
MLASGLCRLIATTGTRRLVGMTFRIVVVFLGFTAIAATAAAQTAGTGRLSGRVTMTTGAALPGVTVRLEGGGTNATAVTEADGRFEIETLVDPSAVYTLKAALPGFRDATRTGVRATPGGATMLLDMALKIGCTDPDLVMNRGIVQEAAVAAMVAHVRIESIATTREREGDYGCTMANEATAFVVADSHGESQRRIGILIPPRDAARYEPGYDAVVALTWDAVAGRYTGWTGSLPVEHGTAALDDVSIRLGLPARMPVNELLDLVAPPAPPLPK